MTYRRRKPRIKKGPKIPAEKLKGIVAILPIKPTKKETTK